MSLDTGCTAQCPINQALRNPPPPSFLRISGHSAFLSHDVIRIALLRALTSFIYQLESFLHQLTLVRRPACLWLLREPCCDTPLLHLTGGATPRVLGRQLPLPPPPPPGAFGQQLVAKGVALRRPWAPKAPDAT